MPSVLSDKLKALGVKIGARDLPPPPPRDAFALERIVPAGRLLDTAHGAAYFVETTYRTRLPARPGGFAFGAVAPNDRRVGA